MDTKKVFPSILNFGKYLFAIVVAVTSFFAGSYNLFKNIWWLLALISTVYSYAWDLKMDFGFLQPGKNYPLREKLSYKNKFFYYFAIVVNLFLRFMWVLTVSPDVVYRFIRPEFFLFLIYLMEVLRRGMWNFIRVEYKHIDICKEFKVTLDIELPFKKNEKGEFHLKNVKFQHEKHNRRLEKLRTATFNDSMLSRNASMVDIKKMPRPSSKLSLKEYEIGDYKKRCENYIKNFQEKTDIILHSIRMPIVNKAELAGIGKHDGSKDL